MTATVTNLTVFTDRPGWPITARFRFCQPVRKRSGSSWHGYVCGWYTTDLTPIGYNVRSAFEINSVQCYPEAALEEWETET